MVDFHNVSACPPAFVPADPTNIKDMLQILVDAKRCAVRGYTEGCNMIFGKEHRTYDLALAILHEAIEHETWFSEFIGEGAERACAPKIGREFSLCQ
jgi:ferritin-like protein